MNDLQALLERAEALDKHLADGIRDGKSIDDLEDLVIERGHIGDDLASGLHAVMMSLADGSSTGDEMAVATALIQRASAATNAYLELTMQLSGAVDDLHLGWLDGDEPASSATPNREEHAEHADAEVLRATLASHLEGGPLAGRDVAVLRVPDSSDAAYAISTSLASAYDDCRWLRDHPPASGFVPLVVSAYTPSETSFVDSMLEANALSRFPFHTGGEEEAKVTSILDRATSLDAVALLDQSARDVLEDEAIDWDEHVDRELEHLDARWGARPPRDALLALATDEHPTLALEQWLYRWERDEMGRTESEGGSYQDWFEPKNDTMAVLVVKAGRPADLLAHCHFFGADSLVAGSALLVALLRHWETRYGAVLVGHFGTMLHFEVERPPATIDEAWELAVQQVTIAPCTTVLGGIPLRDHAAHLVGLGTWFLHERP